MKENQRQETDADFLINPCGKTGIRTLEPLWAATRFPDAPLQPLEHLSFGTANIQIFFKYRMFSPSCA